MGSLTNNFDHIKPILSFEEGYFYYGQIIQRRKDIPDLPTTRILLRTDVITSLEYVESKIDFWMKFCKDNNARMYLSVNRKRFDLTAYKMVELLSRAMTCNDFNPIPNIFSKAVFRTPTDKGNTWVLIDIDESSVVLVADIQIWLKGCGVESYHIPTKNGHHIISRKFNTNKFLDVFGNRGYNLEIKKESPTLLIF